MTKKPKMELRTPRGTHDILPEDYAYYQAFYKKAEEIANYYGFEKIQTPHFESIDLFTTSVGETTDIVEKEMYTLKTKGKEQIVLRPEGTAAIMRAYITNGMQSRKQPVMLQTKGSYFRHERPQKGRYRDFQQFSLEIIGEEGAVAEATIVKVLSLILEELGVGPINMHLNSRGDKDCMMNYRKELLAYYKKRINSLCENCRRRYKQNPFRLLDCKDEKCLEAKNNAPQVLNHLCTPCKKHFKDVLEFLDSSDTPYFLDNNLVRGLDYYTRTVFEFFADEEDQDPEKKPIALGGGGRYDDLAEMLANKEIPGVGGSIGVDRVVQLMKEKKIRIKSKKKPQVFFVQLGASAKYKSIGIIESLRQANISMVQSLSKKSIQDQLQAASELKVQFALILGQKEVIENSIIIRDMNTRAQETVALDKLVEKLKSKLK